VWNNQTAAVAAAHSVDPRRWRAAFGAVIDRIAPRFSRYEPVRHAAGLMLGMLSGLERKNCWTIAEHHGDVTPDGLQHLLARARWDADGVRDDLRDYVIEAFADPNAVLVVDETGDVKKGDQSVGVQRQYTGTAGRVENAQVEVLLTYAARRGHASSTGRCTCLTGLDQHQVRRWTSWHSWTTLAMLAHAFLAVATAIERDHTPAPAGMIELTVNEFRRLFDALLLAGNHSIHALLAWSRWRRRHQARARACHYRRREHEHQ
jgi:SRSO17 transposase